MKKIEKQSLSLFEKLADIEHQRWAYWQAYLHGKCYSNLDGSLTIPEDLVRRWADQIKTGYKDLSEKEKDSDREQVMMYWNFIFDEIIKSLPESMDADDVSEVVKHIDGKSDKEKRALADERCYGFNFCLYLVKASINNLKNNQQKNG